MSRLHVVSTLPCRKGTWTEGRRLVRTFVVALAKDDQGNPAGFCSSISYSWHPQDNIFRWDPAALITPRLGAWLAWAALLGNHGRCPGDILSQYQLSGP